jgi:DNA polymerase-3 subunit delta
MAVVVITGDESLIGLQLAPVIDRLVGDGDRSLMVEDFDCADSSMEMGSLLDAMATMPLFTERRIVLVRSVHSLDAERVGHFVTALTSRADEVDVVVTATGRLVKALNDAFKSAQAETIGVSVGTGARDRQEFVETHLVEAGFTYSPDVARLLATWLGGDQGRLAGILRTLVSTYGEGAKLSRSDVEGFLGEQGSVAPWDLTDAIDAGDTTKALVNLHRFVMAGGAAPIAVLSLLGNRYTQMMKLDGRGVRTAADAAAALGMKEYPARKVLEQFQRLGGSGVAQAMELIATADVDMRGGKDWDSLWVAEVLVARLSRLGGRSTSRR